jgi:hypothetical protein
LVALGYDITAISTAKTTALLTNQIGTVARL